MHAARLCFLLGSLFLIQGFAATAWAQPHTPAALAKGDPYERASLPCAINVACEEAQAWEDEAASVVRIVIGGGACTGVLVNNVRQDRAPYVLTVSHCAPPVAVGQVVDWPVEFAFESPTCEDPAETPAPFVIRGGTVRAVQGGGLDFILLELAEPIPEASGAVFAGWSIEDLPSVHSVAISHPREDLKRIAFDDDPLVSFGNNWRAAFDRGTVEVGSSGGPLFNDRHQLVGLVRSAVVIDLNACSGPGNDDNRADILFPKLSYLWDQGLGAVLDPDATGTTSLPPLSGEQLPIWINELNADARPGNSSERDEFIELMGPAGVDLGGYALDIYACKQGALALRSSQPLGAFTIQDEHDGLGFFVIAGDEFEPSRRDQLFDTQVSGGPAASRHGVLPDGSGRVVLRDPTGTPVFDYQYESGKKKLACPPDAATRSAPDAPGPGTMGFLPETELTPDTPGTSALVPSPHAPNRAAQPVARQAPELPATAVALDAYPNPFNPRALLTVQVDRRQHVEVAVFDMTGRRVARLFDGPMEAGVARTFAFDAANLPSGAYLVRVGGAEVLATKVVTLLK